MRWRRNKRRRGKHVHRRKTNETRAEAAKEFRQRYKVSQTLGHDGSIRFTLYVDGHRNIDDFESEQAAWSAARVLFETARRGRVWDD